jgi:6-phosphogluconolactonase
MKIILGCYSGEDNPGALKLLDFSEDFSRVEVVREYAVGNALYQALSPDGKILYSCTGKGLASFSIQPDALSKIDEITLGESVCHVAVMPGGKSVVWAEYLGGYAGSVAVDEGRFGEIVQHDHAGSGPNLPRQQSAHCHQAVPMPDGRNYAVVDLGIDKIVVYPQCRTFDTVPAGAGPRHLLFHPDGKIAFLVSELGNLISTLRVDAGGAFAYLDTLPTLPEGDTGRGPNGDLAAAVRLSPDGRRVIVSNRGENSLVAYDFDAVTGRLALARRTLLPGSWPRDFIFISGNLALAAMERSGQVHLIEYDQATGGFELKSTFAGFFRPVALTVAG